MQRLYTVYSQSAIPVISPSTNSTVDGRIFFFKKKFPKLLKAKLKFAAC